MDQQTPRLVASHAPAPAAPAPPTVVDIPGVGEVEFPPEMSSAEIAQAASDLRDKADPLVSPSGSGYAHDSGMRESQMPQSKRQAAAALGLMASGGAGIAASGLSIPMQSLIQAGVGGATGLAQDGTTDSAARGAMWGAAGGAVGGLMMKGGKLLQGLRANEQTANAAAEASRSADQAAAEAATLREAPSILRPKMITPTLDLGREATPSWTGHVLSPTTNPTMAKAPTMTRAAAPAVRAASGGSVLTPEQKAELVRLLLQVAGGSKARMVGGALTHIGASDGLGLQRAALAPMGIGQLMASHGGQK